ncbi:pseudouridine synthase [Hymenobacter cavernae]|uniref:Pseudouridine synthase n=1 Tax=Hymenobacter cavernae TaxID=2044852 RepID=A0ABQ1TWC7_9BACT|nr:pseudouridine synthase [Hymenobacter cavernae]GGF02757.1 pseudouridine synthase [Hymenobacter cavernae]
MSKRHNSDDNAGRRGRGNNRPTGNSGQGAESFRKFFDPAAANKPGKGRGTGEGARGDEYPSRPTFGRPTGKPSFGGGNFSRSNDRPGNNFDGPRRSSGGDDHRPFNRESRDDRRSFEPRGNAGGRSDRPNNRFDDRRGSEDRRPPRPFEPKATWSGQPYQQEGKPTVPRGSAGERNRKFNKTNPYQQPEAKPAPAREEGFKRTEDTGPNREIRPARPFDYRGAPEQRGGERDQKPAGGYNRPARPESGFGQRSTGERGLGNRGFGSDRQDGPSRGFNRRDDKGDAPRTFREIREAAKAGERRFGRDASSNQAGKPKRGEVAGQAPDYKNLRHYEEDKNRGNKRRRNEEDFGNETMRLNRYIANAGICSRREADALIAAGEIRVNGEVVTEMGYQVQPSDTVQYGKTNLKREKLVYVLLNKPKDFITTTDDPEGRRTVMDLIAGASSERLFPVGRLDRNTTGLLLFTNDGEVAQKLTHPSHKNKKIYQVELDKPLTEEHLRQIAEGLELEDGKAEVDDVAVVAGNAHFVGIELHIGRNRIVRRIFEHLGYEVVTLDRVQYAGLTKKDLPRGKWRFLNEKEVIRLKYFM